MSGADRDEAAGSTAEGEQPWEKNRRLRQADLDAANAHGRSLLERYGGEASRPGFAVVGRAHMKRRRAR